MLINVTKMQKLFFEFIKETLIGKNIYEIRDILGVTEENDVPPGTNFLSLSYPDRNHADKLTLEVVCNFLKNTHGRGYTLKLTDLFSNRLYELGYCKYALNLTASIIIELEGRQDFNDENSYLQQFLSSLNKMLQGIKEINNLKQLEQINLSENLFEEISVEMSSLESKFIKGDHLTPIFQLEFIRNNDSFATYLIQMRRRFYGPIDTHSKAKEKVESLFFNVLDLYKEYPSLVSILFKPSFVDTYIADPTEDELVSELAKDFSPFKFASGFLSQISRVGCNARTVSQDMALNLIAREIINKNQIMFVDVNWPNHQESYYRDKLIIEYDENYPGSISKDKIYKIVRYLEDYQLELETSLIPEGKVCVQQIMTNFFDDLLNLCATFKAAHSNFNDDKYKSVSNLGRCADSDAMNLIITEKMYKDYGVFGFSKDAINRTVYWSLTRDVQVFQKAKEIYEVMKKESCIDLKVASTLAAKEFRLSLPFDRTAHWDKNVRGNCQTTIYTVLYDMRAKGQLPPYLDKDARAKFVKGFEDGELTSLTKGEITSYTKSKLGLE